MCAHIFQLSRSLFWPEIKDVFLFQDAFQPLEDEKVIENSVPDAFHLFGPRKVVY